MSDKLLQALKEIVNTLSSLDKTDGLLIERLNRIEQRLERLEKGD